MRNKTRIVRETKKGEKQRERHREWEFKKTDKGGITDRER